MLLSLAINWVPFCCFCFAFRQR